MTPSRFKPWGYLAAAGAIVLAACLLLSPIFVPKNNQASFGQIDHTAWGVLGEEPGTVDVFFMGDSEVYTSLDPLQMWHEQGITSYDISTSAQPLPYTKKLLTRALATHKPRVVVLETNMLFRKVSLDDALWREVANIMPILEYHDRWKSLNASDFSGSVKATWTDSKKGYRAHDEIEPATTEGYMEHTDEVEEMPTLNQWYLSSIIDMCRDRGAQVVLLSTPSTKNWSWERHNAVERFLADRPHLSDVTYLDLNLEQEAVPIDWDLDTFDRGDHLNITGACKVSAYMGPWLKERYGLTDHRGDTLFRTWEDAWRRSQGT